MIKPAPSPCPHCGRRDFLLEGISLASDKDAEITRLKEEHNALCFALSHYNSQEIELILDAAKEDGRFIDGQYKSKYRNDNRAANRIKDTEKEIVKLKKLLAQANGFVKTYSEGPIYTGQDAVVALTVAIDKATQ